jgi:hypothetical protein
MSPRSPTLLLAAWSACSYATGAACGTVRSLAQAAGMEEGEAAAAVRALRDAGHLEIDSFVVLAITAAGAEEARRRLQAEGKV